MNSPSQEVTIPQIAEIELRYLNPIEISQRFKITSSKEAEGILRSHWSDQIGFVEEFVILLLDRANHVLGKYLVSKGGYAGTIVDAKIIFAGALKASACGIILAHNHPSGNLRPSQQDTRLTKKLLEAGKLLDIQILDHIILSPYNSYFSFSDEGLL